MKPLVVPERYNYLAIFLTLACNLRCSYCINEFGGAATRRGPLLSGTDWVRALNRLVSRPDLPITLQGGEPSLHPDFLHILRHVRPELNIDLLTNLSFDVESLVAAVSPERLRRDAPYASIRVSYHPETMELEPLVRKVRRLLDAGFSVGVWGVLHPAQADEILRAQERCRGLGIDFRTKEFLGEHEGRFHGTILYQGACGGPTRSALCRTSELIVGPAGGVYRCHSDLYEGRPPIGSLLDPSFAVTDEFLPCAAFGRCNPCDVKVKTNRFQLHGHTSVEIRFPGAREDE